MKSDLTVFKKAPYRWYEIFHRVRWFFRSINCAWERATKGYCYRDLWSMDIFYGKLFEDTLREFNETRHGYPGNMTDEEWGKYLNEMADHFHNCLESNEVYTNPYWDEYYHRVYELNEDENLPENQELYNNYKERKKEIEEKLDSEKDIAFDMLKEKFFHLWD